MEFKRKEGWPGGVNNLAPKDRLPGGTVRSAVNLDPNSGGTFNLRAGYEQVHAGDVRGVLALGDKLLLADGASLIEFDTTTNTARTLRQIAGGGSFSGCVHAGVLYFATATECLEYDGQIVRPWGVPDVPYQPGVAVGSNGALVAGHYQVAVTYLDAWGREGGTDKPLIVTVTDGGSLTLNLPEPPDGGRVALYASAPNGATLYRQDSYDEAATVTLTMIRDDGARLETVLMRAPTPGELHASVNGVIVYADGPTLWRTEPMRPHLLNRTQGWVQYPVVIGEVMTAGSLLYVSADRAYVLAGIDTATPEQRVLMDVPAIPGTGVRLPDGRSAWMTRYGQAITADGSLQLVNRPNFAVGDHAGGAAGVVEHNGNQLIVTAANGGRGFGGLVASDFMYGEILN